MPSGRMARNSPKNRNQHLTSLYTLGATWGSVRPSGLAPRFSRFATANTGRTDVRPVFVYRRPLGERFPSHYRGCVFAPSVAQKENL